MKNLMTQITHFFKRKRAMRVMKTDKDGFAMIACKEYEYFSEEEKSNWYIISSADGIFWCVKRRQL